MSNLVKSLYEMASLRTEYQRLHQDLFGISVRKLMFMARPGARKGVNARIHQLTKRLEELDEDLSHLTADDLVIRRGEEIEVALKDFSLRARGEESDWVKIPSLLVSGTRLAMPAQRVSASAST